MRERHEKPIGSDTNGTDLFRGDRVRLVPDGLGGGHVDPLPPELVGKEGVCVRDIYGTGHRWLEVDLGTETAECWEANLKLIR